MASYPPRGKSPWDVDLKAYIDSQDESTIDLIPPQVEAAVEAHTPGIELAYAERTTTFSVSTTDAALVPGISISVEGQGRPVDIEFYLPGLYHSVADTQVLAAIYYQINGGAALLDSMSADRSIVNTDGPSVFIKRRRIIPEGETWQFHGFIRTLVAGTATAKASGNEVIYIAATSR